MIREGDTRRCSSKLGCGAAERASRGVVGGGLWQKKIVGKENMGGIFWQEKNTWNIGNEQGGWEEGLIVTTENSVSGWKDFFYYWSKLVGKIG